jgi:hypothetical protein
VEREQVRAVRILDGYICSNLPPKPTPLIQHVNPDILKSSTLNHKLLSGPPILRHTRLASIGELASIRISGLEERCKGSSEAQVDQGLGLLDGIYLIPLLLVSFCSHRR